MICWLSQYIALESLQRIVSYKSANARWSAQYGRGAELLPAAL